MTVNATIRTFFAVALGSAAVASSALASGEPKNQLPFTRPLGVARAATIAIGMKHVSSPALASTGESKNQLPFTHR